MGYTNSDDASQGQRFGEESLFCTFDPVVGWRVVKHAPGAFRTILVIPYEGRKLMRIPSLCSIRCGRFLNPKKITLTWLRQKLRTKTLT